MNSWVLAALFGLFVAVAAFIGEPLVKDYLHSNYGGAGQHYPSNGTSGSR